MVARSRRSAGPKLWWSFLTRLEGEGAGGGEEAIHDPAGLGRAWVLAAFVEGHVADFVVPEGVAAVLGLEHEGEGAVAVDVDRSRWGPSGRRP